MQYIMRNGADPAGEDTSTLFTLMVGSSSTMTHVWNSPT